MRYRVVCDNQVPVDQPKTYAHIGEVGTGTTPQHYDRLWSVAEVITANGRGDVFYTLSASTGEAARVIVVGCSVCGKQIIRSSADAITDNNLKGTETLDSASRDQFVRLPATFSNDR